VTALRRSLPGAALLLAALLLAGCVAGMPDDAVTKSIVSAPGEALDLPLHERKAHWLLRDVPRWCAAAEARWGGEPDDPAALTVRAARFRDEVAAARALDKLTPEYLAVAFRDQVGEGPYPVDYPEPLPGDEAKVNEYAVRLPPGLTGELSLVGQFTAVRAGKAVIFADSIGLPADKLIPAFEAMVEAAGQAERGC
jgi:hypothetical protein